ncbi:MAG: winged helix-turn-helix domain-containing protein [Promethearchaeia archaeon]
MNAKSEGNEEDLEDEFYVALSHDLRRKIIKIIGKQEYTSFTSLKKTLKVSTGTIYHHLENLSGLIEQKDDKKYYLTPLGEHAYSSMLENMESIKTPTSKGEFNSPLLQGLFKLTPKRFIAYEEEDKIYTVLLSVIILITGSIFNGLNGSYMFFLFNVSAIDSLESMDGFFQVWLSCDFILNFVLYFLLIEGINRYLLQKEENSREFLASFSMVLFPMVIYLIIHYLFTVTNLLKFSVMNIIDKSLMIFFQVWALWLLTYSLSLIKDIKIENALIISLVLHYSGFSILLFISF